MNRHDLGHSNVGVSSKKRCTFFLSHLKLWVLLRSWMGPKIQTLTFLAVGLRPYFWPLRLSEIPHKLSGTSCLTTNSRSTSQVIWSFRFEYRIVAGKCQIKTNVGSRKVKVWYIFGSFCKGILGSTLQPGLVRNLTYSRVLKRSPCVFYSGLLLFQKRKTVICSKVSD